jgi:hypothetical protein
MFCASLSLVFQEAAESLDLIVAVFNGICIAPSRFFLHERQTLTKRLEAGKRKAKNSEILKKKPDPKLTALCENNPYGLLYAFF